MKNNLRILLVILSFLTIASCDTKQSINMGSQNDWVVVFIDDCDEVGIGNAAVLVETACFRSDGGGNTVSSQFLEADMSGYLRIDHIGGCNADSDTLYILTLRLDEYPNKYFFGLSSSIYVPGTLSFEEKEFIRVKPSNTLNMLFIPDSNSIDDLIVSVEIASVIFERENEQIFQNVFDITNSFTGPDTIKGIGIRNSPKTTLTTIISRKGDLDTISMDFETDCSPEHDVIVYY